MLREAGDDRVKGESNNNPPCVVIMADNYVNHMNFRTIVDWHTTKMEWLNRSESLTTAFKTKFPNTYYDGFRDNSFYDQQRWYSKSSGTCKQKPFLKGIPDSIVETP